MTWIKYYLLSFTLVNFSLCSEEIVVPSNALKIVNQYFEDFSETEIRITPLNGGHSSLNFHIELPLKHYVLRINEKASIERFKCELFAMQEASKAGISPFVFESYLTEKMVLMDYINGSTLTIEEANQIEMCAKIAKVLKRAHAIKTNPYHGISRNLTMEGFYTQLANFPEILEEITQAIEIIRNGHNQIVDMPSSYSVNTHNDLNPGNILVENGKVFLIDWEGTNWEDPFYDLSYFSIFHNYDRDRELNLLKDYLDRPPSLEELQRYYITKKVNFSRISLSCYYIAFIQNMPIINSEIPIKSWEYYAKMFANKCHDDLSTSQLFYNLAKAAIIKSKAINY